MTTTPTRRTILKGAGALAASGSVFAARTGLAQPAIAKGATLTVSTWGGVTSDAVKNFVGPEFQKLTGATLAFDIGGQGARYNKLLAQKANPSADVFFSTDEAVVGGTKAGILIPADASKVPNIANVQDWALTVKNPAGGVAGVPYTLIIYALAYNPETVKTAPTSWGDMWRPEFAGKLALASPVHSCMPGLVQIVAELAGGSATNLEPGLKKLAELRPNKLTVFWTDWAPMLKTGDTTVATEFDYYLETMKAQGYPIDYVLPKEGAIGSPEYVSIVAGTKNKEIAEVFLNLMIDIKTQEDFAVQTFQGPTHKKVTLSDDIAKKTAYGTKIAKLRFFDPVAAFEMRPMLTERLNTEVVPNWRAR